MVPESFDGKEGGELFTQCASLLWPQESLLLPSPIQDLESHSCFNYSGGNQGQVVLVFNVRLLPSISMRLSIPFLL